jgi:hypothetical protein
MPANGDPWDLLAPGGFLIGDDYDQDWPDVIEAAATSSAPRVLTKNISTSLLTFC